MLLTPSIIRLNPLLMHSMPFSLACILAHHPKHLPNSPQEPGHSAHQPSLGPSSLTPNPAP